MSIDLILVRQKDFILSMFPSLPETMLRSHLSRTIDKISASLETVSEFWRENDYSYKYHEINQRLIKLIEIEMCMETN
jgi:hypothetical protein